MREYKSRFITKEKVQRRSKELERQVEQAGQDILDRFSYRVEKPDIKKLSDKVWSRELWRLYEETVEEVFSERYPTLSRLKAR